MDITDFAKEIDGFEYPARELSIAGDKAKENNFVIIYGMSDDLLEIRGVIDDEIGAWDGVKIILGTGGVSVNAVWSPKDKPDTSWEILVDCPHEKFHIMEDGDIYCIGVVIHSDALDAKGAAA